jgi:hypothetical protein
MQDFPPNVALEFARLHMKITSEETICRAADSVRSRSYQRGCSIPKRFSSPPIQDLPIPQLLFLCPPANIKVCMVAPVVAAVCRFARRGDLGFLTVRS